MARNLRMVERFIKNQEIRDEFASSGAYSALLMELVTILALLFNLLTVLSQLVCLKKLQNYE